MPTADHNPERAGFDWRGFARAVRQAAHADGRPLRRLAPAIGVTISDLSRAMGGTNIDAGKVIALCKFAGHDIADFYLPPEKYPEKSTCFTASHVEHRASSDIASEGG